MFYTLWLGGSIAGSIFTIVSADGRRCGSFVMSQQASHRPMKCTKPRTNNWLYLFHFRSFWIHETRQIHAWKIVPPELFCALSALRSVSVASRPEHQDAPSVSCHDWELETQLDTKSVAKTRFSRWREQKFQESVNEGARLSTEKKAARRVRIGTSVWQHGTL